MSEKPSRQFLLNDDALSRLERLTSRAKQTAIINRESPKLITKSSIIEKALDVYKSTVYGDDQ